MTYRDRIDAGRRLAQHLKEYAGRANTIVLALPRGGVPVAYEVARALALPLDVFVVRKLGVPGQRELAMGAVASGGCRVLNSEVVTALRLSEAEIASVTAEELRELERREHLYRGNRPPLLVDGKTVIVVDDGIATGSTILAAIKALERIGAAHIVVAVPVAPEGAVTQLGGEVDAVVCPMVPEWFFAIGEFYDDFSQTDDDTVRSLLERAATARVAG